MAYRRIVLTPRKLGRFFESFDKKLQEEMIAAERRNGEMIREGLKFLSSQSGYEAVDQIHPYSKKRWPFPVMDPGIIHERTGDFAEGWKMKPPSVVNGSLETVIKNFDPKARFILAPGGTVKMFERPIRKRVISLFAARIGRNRREAMSRAMLQTPNPGE